MTTEIKFVTWNVDGLGAHARIERAKRASEEILAENPDIISLQEVVAVNGGNIEEIFDEAFSADGGRYTKFCPKSYMAEYFTVTYVKKCFALSAEVRRQSFSGAATSMMGRDMLCVILNICGVSLMVINTHLESMKTSTLPRTMQLEEICKLMLKHPGPAIVGGDLNMRDKEQKAAFSRATGGDEKAMIDAYDFFGKPKNARVTWELPDQPTAKGRFDRIYHNKKGVEFIHPSIVMIGKEVIDSVGVRPSDHLGLRVSVVVNHGDPTSLSSTPSKKRALHKSADALNAAALREKRLKRFDSVEDATLPAGAVSPRASAAKPCAIEVVDLT